MTEKEREGQGEIDKERIERAGRRTEEARERVRERWRRVEMETGRRKRRKGEKGVRRGQGRETRYAYLVAMTIDAAAPTKDTKQSGCSARDRDEEDEKSKTTMFGRG